MAGLDTRAIQAEELKPSEFPAVRHAFRIHISEEAFDAAVAHGGQDVTREVGGILVGEICTDEQGPFVSVETTIEALHADEKGTELTFTHATWDHIHAEMDKSHPGKRILGWYHTHPGFGIFLSDRDQFIQRSFFNLPYQIALVYDPKSREHGVFAWHEGEPRRCQRYCVGATEHEWYPPVPRATETDRKTETNKEGSPMPDAANANVNPPDMDRVTLLFGALILIVLGGLGGWWMGSWSSAAELKRTREALVLQKDVGARDLARLLNHETLALVRQAMGGEAQRRPFVEAVQLIDEGMALVGEDGQAPQAALDKIKAGRQRVASYHDRHVRAESMLFMLEQAARDGQLNPRQVGNAITTNRAALGQICVEIAEDAVKAGDRDRAARLLRLAAKVDEEKHTLYQNKLNALTGEEK